MYNVLKFGKNGTLISFGCYSECWDEKNKPQTIKLIKYFLEKGNQIQVATKNQRHNSGEYNKNKWYRRSCTICQR